MKRNSGLELVIGVNKEFLHSRPLHSNPQDWGIFIAIGITHPDHWWWIVQVIKQQADNYGGLAPKVEDTINIAYSFDMWQIIIISGRFYFVYAKIWKYSSIFFLPYNFLKIKFQIKKNWNYFVQK